MTNQSSKATANRRQFMKASVGATALSAAGLNVAAAAASPPPEKWDVETDVLIMGYGGAGANTAITAADAGADVVVLEKNPVDLHICNTNVSGGYLLGPTDSTPANIDKAFQYIKACIGETVDDELCRVWAEQTAINIEYLKQLADAVGVPSEFNVARRGAEFPNLPGADGITSYVMKAGPGAKIYEVLDKNVKKRSKIKVEFSTPGKRIVLDSNGQVQGIIAEKNGKDFAVRGRRATVLASGGYEFNEQMKRNSFFGNPRYFYGTNSNTGDGLAMAMAAGADLWHMNWSSQHYGFYYKDFPVGLFASDFIKPNYMIVDQYGRRFYDDSFNGHCSYLYLCVYDPLNDVYPRLPAYLIFDETVRTQGRPFSPSTGQAGGVMTAAAGKFKYIWSEDQSAEIAKGWIMKANSIEDLVKAINARQGPNPFNDYTSSVKMDPAVLAATVKTFNGYAAQKNDPEFGRKTLGAIETGPFYATELWPVGANTLGGPRFNTKGQVVDPYGKPIARLYKCGELGSIYGPRYSGGNLSELLAFGRVVGKNAAAESA